MTGETPLEEDPLWYQDAIIYQLHVKAFLDSTGDGTGDFRGLAQKLDYIQDLGVNTVWLLPFYPSPMRDDGYDISDYRNIHPDYGTRRDFRRFVREAHRRGIRVITELVINHTSDQHPWFQAARQARPGTSKRNFYVWSDDDTKFPETRIIFTDSETSNWSWDPVARQYYWHRFFSHQPDLNHNNPRVVDAVIRVMRFWLDMGVDGLRLDAVPYLCVREGTNNENLPETHEVIRRMRAEVDKHYANRMFLAEANQWPEDVRDYFGDGDECHMAYHFPLMPRMYVAIAQEDRHPIVEIMRQTPDIPAACQWAIFLRNHDELTLEMVTDRERDYMYQTYATDPRMRVNVGIRRRLAPLLDNDPDKIKLMNSLLMSMPGSPIIYYGDEIGMGDNFFLGDRNGVRTPMQWSPDRNAGFSKADPQRLYLPPVMDPVYGYEAVNVEAQSRDPASLLNWMKRLIAIRKTHQAFGRGSLHFLRPGNRKILAYLRIYEGDVILCVANLSHTAQPVELDLGAYKGFVPVEMMGHIPFPPIGELPYLLTLPAYGVYWFQLAEEAEVPAWHDERLPPVELPVLVLFEGARSFFPEQVPANRRKAADDLRQQMEREVLPAFIQGQRWFAAKGEPVARAELERLAGWPGHPDWLLAWVRVHLAGGASEPYFVPLSVVWDDSEERVRTLHHAIAAKVRRQARVGLLHDAFADEGFVLALVRAMEERREVAVPGGVLHFSRTAAFDERAGTRPEDRTIRRPAAEGSNTAVTIDEDVFIKGYRRLQEGINAELEMGRFLTETSPFAHIIPVLGAVEFCGEDGSHTTLALAQGYVKNQGDGWSYTQDYLERFLYDCLAAPPAAEPAEVHAAYRVMMETLGRRTGELHQALAQTTGDPAFDPEPVTEADVEALMQRLRGEAGQTLALVNRQTDLPEEVRVLTRRLAESEEALLAHIADLTPAAPRLAKIRHHGDYHLGQVLVVENDFVIIDFEGEPARPLAERQAKQWALRDVSGMLRSFDYAAYGALYRATAERPADFEALEPHAAGWLHLTADAFLNGYREAACGCPAYPEDPAQADRLIHLFTLEKALYELRYELKNRPDWARIPLRGILAMLG